MSQSLFSDLNVYYKAKGVDGLGNYGLLGAMFALMTISDEDLSSLKDIGAKRRAAEAGEAAPIDPSAEKSPDGPATHLDRDKKKEVGRSFTSTQLAPPATSATAAAKRRPRTTALGGGTTLGGSSSGLKTLLGE